MTVEIVVERWATTPPTAAANDPRMCDRWTTAPAPVEIFFAVTVVVDRWTTAPTASAVFRPAATTVLRWVTAPAPAPVRCPVVVAVDR
jgi:hypothetical protein